MYSIQLVTLNFDRLPDKLKDLLFGDLVQLFVNAKVLFS